MKFIVYIFKCWSYIAKHILEIRHALALLLVQLALRTIFPFFEKTSFSLDLKTLFAIPFFKQ